MPGNWLRTILTPGRFTCMSYSHASAQQGILMWSFPGRETMASTPTHTAARRKTRTSPSFVQMPFPLPSVAAREVHYIHSVGALVCQCGPPPTCPHHYKTDHNLLSSPASVHLEPVCASPGCSCPTQRDQELQEGRDDDEEEHNSEGRGKTAADLKLPTTAQTALHYK